MGLPEQEPSPEEILLRLIKDGKKKPSGAGASMEAESSQAPSVSSLSSQSPALGGVMALPSALRRLHIPWQAWAQQCYSDLHLLPRILLVLSSLLATAILFNTVNDRIQSKRRLETLWTAASRTGLGKTGAAFAASAAAPQELPPKDLFKLSAETPAPVSAGQGPAHISLDQVLSNFSLAGIVGGDEPQAIIEDKRQGKTFFLKAGDSLGEIRIVAVRDGKVVVAIGNEQAELDI